MNKTIAAILFLGVGLLLGVAFVATSAKFLARSLPRVQALDVGRWTFHMLTLIEWRLVVVVAALVAIAWRCWSTASMRVCAPTRCSDRSSTEPSVTGTRTLTSFAPSGRQ